jgi:hypothetical protein
MLGTLAGSFHHVDTVALNAFRVEAMKNSALRSLGLLSGIFRPVAASGPKDLPLERLEDRGTYFSVSSTNSSSSPYGASSALQASFGANRNISPKTSSAKELSWRKDTKC